jgi:hypothetical protein
LIWEIGENGIGTRGTRTKEGKESKLQVIGEEENSGSLFNGFGGK